MFTVLPDADFSKNNIGKVDLSLPIDDLTLEILSKYSVQPSEYVQKALNTFVIRLKNTGLIDKISSLYLPILATTIPEAFMDVLGSNSIDGTGKYNITSGKGVHLTVTTGFLAFNIPNTVDFHAMAYNSDAIPVVSGIGYSIGQDVYGFGRRMFNTGTNPGAFIGASGSRITGDTNLGSVIGIQLFSNNGTQSILGDNGQVFTGTPAGDYITQVAKNLNIGSAVLTGVNFSIYSTGAYLNSDEVTEYMSCVSSLMESITS